jgi:hypothetical protein
VYCPETDFPYKGKQPLPIVVALVQQRGSKIMDELLEAAEHCDREMSEDVDTVVNEIATICADFTDLGSESQPQRTSDQGLENLQPASSMTPKSPQ